MAAVRRAVLGDIGDAGDDIGEPGKAIDFSKLGGGDQAEHECGPLPAAVGASEQPRLLADGDIAHGARSGILDDMWFAGMAKAFGELAASAEAERLNHAEWLALLLDMDWRIRLSGVPTPPCMASELVQ